MVHCIPYVYSGDQFAFLTHLLKEMSLFGMENMSKIPKSHTKTFIKFEAIGDR